MANKYQFETQIRSVIAKMHRALELIHAQHKGDRRVERIQSDLTELEDQLQKIIFWEEGHNLKDMESEEWLTLEKKRELQLKKLMTVTKSKYYMIKVNFKAIFDQVDFEVADQSRDQSDQAYDPNEMSSSERIEKDLKRSDLDKGRVQSSQEDILRRLKNPINISQSSEDLDSEAQLK